MSSVNEQKKRGRKSTLFAVESDKKIIMKQHHFKYSDEFAEKLANFATANLDVKNKEFKTLWKIWVDTNRFLVEKEIERMKETGYEGSVEEKMYFSSRYYYRKKAIREKIELDEPEPEDNQPQRKKYDCIDKNVLIKMNEHIVSQILLSTTNVVGNDQIVSNMTPSKAFSNYCETFGICDDESTIKKKYKNLYWRLSNKMKNE